MLRLVKRYNHWLTSDPPESGAAMFKAAFSVAVLFAILKGGNWIGVW